MTYAIFAYTNSNQLNQTIYATIKQQNLIEDGWYQHAVSLNYIQKERIYKCFEQKDTTLLPAESVYEYLNQNWWKPERQKKQKWLKSIQNR